MSQLFLLYLFAFFNIICSAQVAENSKCLLFDSCSSCIRELGCAWCISSMQLSDFRACLDQSQIKELGSSCTKIINPQREAEIIADEGLSTGQDAVQIRPQKIRVKLRRGQEYKLNFQYAQAEDYPVDLYYVMDLSGSMADYRDQLSRLGYKLAETMRNLTKNFRLGFGSFVDKAIYPFERYTLSDPCKGPSCDYVFQNHLSLTDREDLFSTKVERAALHDGGDVHEDALDAILQAIVCRKEIGWREKARHLLVFTSDASFHLAGEGRTAGIVVPHDGQCHMENGYYTHGLLQDFPSIGLINYKALQYGVNVIFAVTRHNIDDYILLQKQIKNSYIKILMEDSSNVIELIKEFYDKIVDSVQISDNSDNNVEVKYFSSCSDGRYKERNKCDDIRKGVPVNFTAVLKLIECPKSAQKTKSVFIKPSGLNEALEVQVELSCSCDCESPGQPYYKANASECSGVGHLKCGICDCPFNKLGSSCECDRDQFNSATGDSNCRPDNSTEFCSGLGVCRCDKCICQKRNNPNEVISGKYCQCNNYSCKRHHGQLCSGSSRGSCSCGKCRCLAGFTGEACECPLSQASCVSPTNNKVCSGKGECLCGKCACKQDGYSGQFCEECDSCKGSRCMEIQHCVECNVFKTGPLKSNCLKKCLKYEIEHVPVIDEDALGPKEKLCLAVDETDCYFKFKYLYRPDKPTRIVAQEERICSQTSVLALIFIIIASILLGGLILLIALKTVTDIHDRREFAKFEAERKGAGWHSNDNPLFKNATTSFVNPTYNDNLD